MVSWKINSVFIGLNEDCWLGINGVKSQYGGQNYINAIKAEVSAAEANGIFPVVGFFWGDPGTEVSSDSMIRTGAGSRRCRTTITRRCSGRRSRIRSSPIRT